MATTQTIIGDTVPNIPWQDRPANCKEVVWRHSQNPIIGLRPFPKAWTVYNSSVVPYEGGFMGVFRVDYRCMTPNLHLGRSKDGLKWEIEEERIQFVCPDPEIAEMNFAYDPRLCKIDDKYYVIWCNTYHGPTIGLAWTKDFKTFHQLENAFLPYNRNGVLFPRKINGKYAMLSRPSGPGAVAAFGDIFFSESPDLCYWGKHRVVLTRGPRKWERVKVGAGPVPIETTEGWLMFYHGVADTCDGLVYSYGAALLDIDKPWQIRHRCKVPLIAPEEIYETAGFVGNVVFPVATVNDSATGRIAIYYGCADTVVGVAYTQVDELIAYIKANS